MKKEIIIFGAVVVLCLGVTAFALMKPAKPKPTSTDLGTSSSLADSGSGLDSGSGASGLPGSGSPGSLGSTDAFGGGTSQFPPSSDLNPNKPFDSTIGSQPGSGISQPAGNPFPGSSTTSSTSTYPGSTPTYPGSTSTYPGSTSTYPGSTAPATSSTTGLGLDPIPATGETRIHEVKKGEILSDISKKYYGTSKHWRKIADANNVKEDGLKPGMKLTIPALEAASAPVSVDTTGLPDSGTYVVKKGDSYYKIAKKELGDASRFTEIQKLNGIAPEDLHEGLKLKLPAKGGARDTAVLPGPEAPAGSRTHVVADGEYLSDISKRYYGSTKHWQDIVKANPGVSPEHLKVGQKLVIPERAGAASTGPVAPDVVLAADEYEVKKGDTFEVIASKVLGDKKLWPKIQAANPGVDPSALKIGQKLKLPAGASHSESIPVPAPAPLLPGPAFPAPVAPLGAQPSSAIPAPAATPGSASDPWALPAASPAPAPTTTSPGSTLPPASDPWKDFATPASGGTGTGTRP